MKKLKIFFIALFLCSTISFAETASTPAIQTCSERPITSFFLHAGLLDFGLGMKVRLSQENGIYQTLGLMWQGYHSMYIRMPILFYLGGNHIHFIIGATLLNVVSFGDPSGELALGVNWDFNDHWGLNFMTFVPVFGGGTGGSLLLDVRYVF